MLSMTGFGEAQQQAGGEMTRVEIRAVNNRHFKLISRLPEGYNSLESDIEAVVRDQVRRGSLQLTLTVTRDLSPENCLLNEAIILGYFQQLQRLAKQCKPCDQAGVPHLEWGTLLNLPGAVGDTQRSKDLEQEWPVIQQVVRDCIGQLNTMRAREGAALAADLMSNLQVISRELQQIEGRAPEIVRAYETRLLDRINQLLSEHKVQADPTLIVREVGVFAERSDISEEIVRLRSHLQQFENMVQHETAPGRKLDFMIQEMLRETNTIGSKANDAQVARHVVEIKTAIERLREMVQNVE
ncbi:MAG: YicC family protein [Planctomycetales bacterium]|nr:YicC family protein [Planctomycetales bacterium]